MPAFEEQGLPKPQRTILVVEDNGINRTMLCALLEDEYDVLEAADGREGIEQIQQHHESISLVLLDVYMPNVDGFEFLRFRQSDERFANIPVIVATASDNQSDEVECLKLGANDFVRKPYDAEIIRNRVNNTIRLRESASMVNQLRWDATTGLYREDFFYRRVENVLEAYPDRAFDMVCCDIRKFKTLNDRYGRETCNGLLHDLATRLAANIPGVMASGRIGGDSFGYFIEHQDQDWTGVLDEIVKGLDIGLLYVRFGIVENVDHDVHATLLCDRATTAIDQLRDSVGAGVAYYDEALRQHQLMERAIIENLDEGLRERQFMVYYQPKHNVNTGQVAGAEALARWFHPELGLVQPTLFINALERNGLISQLDMYVCDEACRELARLQELGLPVVPISINISPLDFDDRDLPERILEIADRYNVDHSLLHLELTETAYADDPEDVVNALERLRSYGFRIELDDFGSGYSSLALLNTLPLDILKIDGGMVRHATRLDDFRIIQSAIQIAQILGLETVIEGVETPDALDRFRDMGCDLVQGFYYSWPLRQDDFEAYLER